MATLAAEMSAPRVTASALYTPHELQPPSRSRKLHFVDAFHGYACSRCGCRFPESRARQGSSPAETRRLYKALRKKQFAKHICSST
jgi:hypothetical protein